MKEDIIAANLSSLRADIQALPQKIAEELNQNATEQSDSSLQIDETKVASTSVFFYFCHCLIFNKGMMCW